MRPVMGAPDDTAQIHGMCDQIEKLQAELTERERKLKVASETIKSLQDAMSSPSKPKRKRWWWF